MFLHEEVNDLQSFADKYFKFGGIPLISRRHSQLSNVRYCKKRQSSKHSGRVVKLFPDRFNIDTLADHMTTIERNSSDKLHFFSWTCPGLVHTMELNLSFFFGNRQPSEIMFDRFGILKMPLGNLSIPFPTISKLTSPVRF